MSDPLAHTAASRPSQLPCTVAAFCSLIVTAMIWFVALPATAQQADDGLEDQFQGWIETVIWPEAEAVGVSRATFERAFAGVRLDLTLPELELPGRDDEPAIDQAEFRSPAPYFDEAGLQALARIGREERDKWSATLAALEDRYGVPAEIVLSIWARESAFGRASIPHYAVEALATGAFLGRRADRFRSELIAALQILEAGHVAPEGMRSSWAGGLGLPQFLPTSFLAYAIDFDGDGRRDIWSSVPDALASIANYLSVFGWDTGIGWGEEVTHPSGLPCTLEGPHQGLPLVGWRIQGIAVERGRAGEPHYLLMPAGQLGPSFLVTDNFYVLKEYNRSDLYALYVGHLADRISGRDDRIDGQWQPIDHLTYGEIQTLQLWLFAAGYDVGTAGLVGYKTRIAVGAAEVGLSLPLTCFPNRRLLEAAE